MYAMDPNLQNNRPAFPNSDQPIPGVIDASRPQQEAYVPHRPTVNILDAINSQKVEDPSTQRLHTFQEDLAKSIKDDNVSMIKMAMAEKKRQEEQGIPETAVTDGNSKKYILVGAIIVAAVAILGGTGFIMYRLSNGTPSNPGTSSTAPTTGLSLLFTESKTSINIEGKDVFDVKKLINTELSKPLQLGSMKALLLVMGAGSNAREITLEEFLKGLQTGTGESLARSLDSRFLLGIYSFNSNDLFLLAKVTSYDNAFAAMLQFEPDVENSIGSIFIRSQPIAPPAPVVPIKQPTQTKPVDPEGVYLPGEEPETPPEDTAEETTAAAANAIQQNRKTWVDRVVNNKDSRVLVDSKGKMTMMYTFLDKQTLVIASSEKALKEIMFRLTTGRISR